MIDWETTIKEHGRLVWTIAFKLLGNEADASDCFQEVFVNAVQAAKKRHIYNMSGFLSVLATRQAIDLIRKRSRRQTFENHTVENQYLPGRELTPFENMQNVELGVRLRQGLSRLADMEAQVFCLQALNDFSYRQIADELNIDENYVGVLLHRARTKLQTFLNSVTVKERREVANE